MQHGSARIMARIMGRESFWTHKAGKTPDLQASLAGQSHKEWSLGQELVTLSIAVRDEQDLREVARSRGEGEGPRIELRQAELSILLAGSKTKGLKGKRHAFEVSGAQDF